MGSTPDLEACKADAEAEVLINALRRLSSLTGMDDSAFAAMGPFGRTTLPRLSASRRRLDTKSRGVGGKRKTQAPRRPGGGSTIGTDTEEGAGDEDETSDASPCEIVRDVTAILLADTDSYIASLLFKPHPVYPDANKSTQVEGIDQINPEGRWTPPPQFTSPPQCAGDGGSGEPGSSSIPRMNPGLSSCCSNPTSYPYSNLSPEIFPSSSRAWASAAHLYLHVILEPLWFDPPGSGIGSEGITTTTAIPRSMDPTATDSSSIIFTPDIPVDPALFVQQPQQDRPYQTGQQQQQEEQPKRKPIDDPHLLRLLLDTLQADIQHTEQAMRIGAYSKELWIWKVLVGAYTLAVVEKGDVFVMPGGTCGPHFGGSGGGGGGTGAGSWGTVSVGSSVSPPGVSRTETGRRTSPPATGTGMRICPEGAKVTADMAVRLGGAQSRPQHEQHRSQRKRQTTASQAQSGRSSVSPGFGSPVPPVVHGVGPQPQHTHDNYLYSSSASSSPASNLSSSGSDRYRYQNPEQDNEDGEMDPPADSPGRLPEPALSPRAHYQHESEPEMTKNRVVGEEGEEEEAEAEDSDILPLQTQTQIIIKEDSYLPDMRSWFSSKIRSWSRAKKITSWQGGRENLSKIAWPEHLFSVEVLAAGIWEGAISQARR